MNSLIDLLTIILPLSLLAAASPVIFLNAANFVIQGQRSSAVGYLTGNCMVLLPIGGAAAGLLGATIASQLHRDIASRVVDGALGLVLLGYGVWMIRRAERPASDSSGADRGAVPFGIVAMATNFTTLPLYMSAAQHIGAARPSLGVAILLILLITAITLTPAWLPLGLTRVAPDLLTRFTRTRPAKPHARTWTIGAIIPIAACMLGGTVLLTHAAGLVGH